LLDKRALRARMRAARDAFAMDGSQVIAPPPEYLERLAPGRVIASYVPLGSEADPSMLAWAARERGCTLALPFVIDRQQPIRFLIWDVDAPLVAGPLGLRQPADDTPEAAPDIILTPLVAFDPALNRLGQGAGHYDRAFERHPAAWRLGIAFSVQQVPLLPADPWDVPLHAILTEQGLLMSPNR
jgi:5-formyltetrahydrofolate cyclo-ligase